MAEQTPIVVIRAGSHAEKEYLLKLAPFMDGLTVGANLFESTPGATASLLLNIGGKNTRLYIDPMTYAFGAYVDPTTGRVRTDLDWIKSEQNRKDKNGNKRRVREFKRSYLKLSEALGLPISEAIKHSRAVTPGTFDSESKKSDFCRSVGEYQLGRVAQEFENDEELIEFAGDAPKPAAVFAPYFYVEPSDADAWLKLNLDLMRITAGLGLNGTVHGILCADVSHLASPAFRASIIERLPATGVKGIWLWFSGFFENSADKLVLEGYRELIESLSKKIEVYAMRGGFLSLALSKFGLQGIGHGVGYGEQKDVVPVIGQSIPTVQYYLPTLRIRVGVPKIERAFDALGITTPAHFHEKVCHCAVCRGVVANSLKEFSAFGDMRFSRSDAKRKSQTPAAAKRCRYHFLLTRILERDRVRGQTPEDIAMDLDEAISSWATQPTLSKESDHLQRWADVLRRK